MAGHIINQRSERVEGYGRGGSPRAPASCPASAAGSAANAGGRRRPGPDGRGRVVRHAARHPRRCSPAPPPAWSAVILVVTSFDLIVLALGTSLVAAFTLSWNGAFVGPVRPGDVLALLAVLLFVLGNDGKHLPRIPFWMWQVVVGIVLVVALNLIFPPERPVRRRPDDHPAAQHDRHLAEDSASSPRTCSPASSSSSPSPSIPAMFAFAVLYARHYARRLIVLFAIGAGLSGWVAILAKYGLNTINLVIGTHGGHGTRQIGLAEPAELSRRRGGDRRPDRHVAAGRGRPHVPVAGRVHRQRLRAGHLRQRVARRLGHDRGCRRAVDDAHPPRPPVHRARGARRWPRRSSALFLFVPSSVEAIGATTRLFGNSASHVTGYSDLERTILSDQAHARLRLLAAPRNRAAGVLRRPDRLLPDPAVRRAAAHGDADVLLPRVDRRVVPDDPALLARRRAAAPA